MPGRHSDLLFCLQGIPKLSGGWKPSENADARSLQLDLKVRLNTLGGLNNILQHGIELIIIDIQNHLLGHKADGSAVHAGQLFDGIFNFGGAVCTINFDFEKVLSDRKSTRLNSSHRSQSRMPSSA